VGYGWRTDGGVVAGGSGGEDRLEEVERILGTDQADRLTVGGAATELHGRGGDDVLDGRGGRPTGDLLDCGGQPDDVAYADPEDHVVHCARVVLPEVALPASAAQRPSVRAEPGQLAATPALAGRELRLVVVAVPRSTVTASASLRTWTGTPLAEPAAVQGRAERDRLARIAVALPDAALAELRRDGRLRGTLRVRIAPDGSGAPLSRELGFLVAVRRAPQVRVDGLRARGGFGRQRMLGGPLGDLLRGDSADDELLGGTGGDHLLGGTGNDGLHGGDGRDLLDGGDGDDVLRGEAGDDDLHEARFGDDALDGGDGDDALTGGRGGDTLAGGAGDDVLFGGSGSDRVGCGPGEDIAFVNFASELRRVAADCELVLDEPGVVHLPCAEGGTDGPETVLGTDGPDRCSGLGGADDVEGRGGDDVLDGGDGPDRIFGRFGRDVLRGGPGDDELEGGRGRDALDGGEGRDRLNGGYDPDVVRGGPGDDRVIARGGGTDVVDCGPGARDVAIVDSRDRVRGCERVSRSGARRR
jgi:hypothetical protein